MNAIEKALTKVFGSANERLLKKLWPVVARINVLEPEISRLSDEELRAKTEEFKARLTRRLEGSEELSPEARTFQPGDYAFTVVLWMHTKQYQTGQKVELTIDGSQSKAARMEDPAPPKPMIIKTLSFTLDGKRVKKS